MGFGRDLVRGKYRSDAQDYANVVRGESKRLTKSTKNTKSFVRETSWIAFPVTNCRSLYLIVLRTMRIKFSMSSSVVSKDVMNRASDISSFQT